MARSISRFGTDRTWLENNWVIYATLQKLECSQIVVTRNVDLAQNEILPSFSYFILVFFFSTEILILEKF